MIKTNTILLSVGVIIILILSVINTTSIMTTTPTNNPLMLDPYPQLDAEKKVKYGSSGWADEIQVPIGTIVRFNITIIYHDINRSDSCRILSKINIIDHLGNFEYKNNLSCSWPTINPKDYLSYNNTTNIYIWKFGNNLTLSETSSSQISVFYLEFDAKVNHSGSFRNYVEMNGTESCCGRYAYSNADAFVNVSEPENPDICLTKYVKENIDWVKNTSVNICDTLYFKLVLHNSGNVALTNINITEDLPAFLRFNNDSNIIPDVSSDHHIRWTLGTLAVDQIVEILFSVNATASGEADNYAIVTTEEKVTDDDTAHIIVMPQGDLHCTKKVWDKNIKQWVDQINANLKDTVRFNITFTYSGAGNLTDIEIVDKLPSCLNYTDNATRVETGQSNNKLFWNLSDKLTNGQSISIEFTTLVISSGTNINTVNITGKENCCSLLNCQDAVTIIVEEPPSNLECEKKVWDQDAQRWVEEINMDVGDTVRFNITLTYNGDGTFIDIHVVDVLPAGLQYANNASLVETGKNSSVVFWNLSDMLSDGQSISIEFDALAVSSGANINTVNITGYEHCIKQLYCEDIATVIIAELPPLGDLECKKKVWDQDAQRWVEEINVDVGDTVRFNITLAYNGDGTFLDIHVVDVLPVGLQYANNASLVETGKNITVIFWNLSDMLSDGQSISIEFDALAISSGTNINTVNISGYERCFYLLSCEDTATAIVAELPLQCEKKVWDSDTQQWVEEINAEIGDIVRFKISVSYWGSLAFYNIWINDTLPTCLQYNNNTTPYQPVVNGKKVSWYIVFYLKYGQSVNLEFDTLVISDGKNINIVNVSGWKCGIEQLLCEDTATVLVERQPDPLIAEAGGSYNGYANEPIQLIGSATGGVPPFIYTWDLDNDGDYDDASGANPTHTWDAKGIYTIHIKATDTIGTNDTDSAQVSIDVHNTPPNTPNIPEGPASGRAKRVISYSSSAVDPDGDMVYLLFDWGDGNTSGWLGPFTSGSSHEANHTWTTKGTYNVKVKTKDIHGEESLWSNPLKITITRSFSISYITFLENLSNRFSALENFFKTLLNILETMKG